MSTLREIVVGEELTYDYKFSKETDPDVLRIPCRCGSGKQQRDTCHNLSAKQQTLVILIGLLYNCV